MADDTEGTGEDPKKLLDDARKLADEKLKGLQSELEAREKVLKSIREQGLAADELAKQALDAAVEQALAQEEINKLRKEQLKIIQSTAGDATARKEALADNMKEIENLKDSNKARQKIIKTNNEYKKTKPIEGLKDLLKAQKDVIGSLTDWSIAGKELGGSLGGLAGKMKNVGKDGGRLNKIMGGASKATGGLGKAVEKGGLEKLSKGLGQLSKLPVIGDKFAKLKKGLDFVKGVPEMAQKVQKLGKVMQGLSKVRGLGWMARAGTLLSGMSVGAIALAAGVAIAVAALVAAVFAIGKEIDTMSKQIASATGFANDFHSQLTETQAATFSAGVSFKELAKTLQALSTGFSKFDPKNEAVNNKLVETVSLLGKIGVTAETSVKAIDHFTRAMGMSEAVAADMTAELAMTGRQMGITSGKMVSDFSSASGRLAMYGADNIKVFKDLEAQIKATGLEMNTMLGISQQYDSFDKAAESAAKLNSVLGTQLSSLELLNATDSERITMIRQQVKLSVGGNFDSLDKFTKLHIAEAMGLKDVAEAQRLLNMEQSEYNKYLNAANENLSADELKKRARENVTLGESMGVMADGFGASMKEATLSASRMVKTFSTMFVSLGEGLAGSQVLRFIGAALAIIFEIITAITKPLGYFLGWIAWGADLILTPFAAVLELVAHGFRLLFDVLHLSGSPMLYLLPEYMAKGFELLGNAAAWLGNKLMSPVRALSALWDIFHKPGSDMLYELPNYFARALDAVSAAAGTLGNVLLFPVKALGFLWDIFHKPGSDMLYELPNYFASALGAVSGAASILGSILFSPVKMLQSFAEAFITVKDNISEIVGDMTGLLAVINEFASLDFDGFIAVRADGGSTSMVMGSEGIIKQMSEGKLEIDINMPEIKLPEINIEVVFMDNKLEGIIDARIAAKVGGAG